MDFIGTGENCVCVTGVGREVLEEEDWNFSGNRGIEES